jgi:hypothetical protein
VCLNEAGDRLITLLFSHHKTVLGIELSLNKRAQRRPGVF